MLTNLGQKGHVDYFCKNCNFKTSHKSKYDRHLDTRKHKLLTCSE